MKRNKSLIMHVNEPVQLQIYIIEEFIDTDQG